MLGGISEWPVQAKVVGCIFAAIVAFVAWNSLASLLLCMQLGQWRPAPPLTWLVHYHVHPYRGYSPYWNSKVGFALRSSAFLSFLLPGALGTAILARLYGPKISHDNARWATWRDLRKFGFSPRHGLYIAKFRGRFLRLLRKKRKHILLCAPTQSGKGVGTVKPVALTDPSDNLSLIVLDPKLEAFSDTSGWQEEIGAHVVLFAPLSPTAQTAQYNPCVYVRRLPDGRPSVDTWNDIEDIVNILVPRDDRPFWVEQGRKTFTGGLAFLSETDGADFSVPGACKMFIDPDGRAKVGKMLEDRRRAGRPYSYPCAAAMRDWVSGHPETMRSVQDTINGKLAIFLNPRVAAAMSENTFDLRKIREERTALYIGVSFSDFEKLQPVLSLLFQQFIVLTERSGITRAPKFDTVMVLDEFVELGRMEQLRRAFSWIAGYGVTLLPIVQTPAQLKNVYMEDGARTIMDNCKVEMYISPDDMRIAQEISKALGTVRGVRHGLWSFSRPQRPAAVDVPLMSPHELMTMDESRVIIRHGGNVSANATRIRYYEHAPFKHRLRPPAYITPIEINLAYDEGGRDQADDSAQEQPKTKRRAKREQSAEPSASEKVLLAATGGKADCSQFSHPSTASAEIDRIMNSLTTRKRS